MLSYLALALTTWALVCQGAPEEDLITSLPGADFEISFAQYSGYLGAASDKKLHYWFTESQRDPTTDPIILWLNGGPGCSSLDGFLAELGPFKIDSDGVTVLQNPYSWNLNASVLFLEAPACVGFSYDDDDDCAASDDTTSQANYDALQEFFSDKFPEYRENEFYITGESYAGVYVPTLSQRVVEGNANGLDAINFKGFAVGNGLLSYELNDNSQMFMAYHYGIFGEVRWDKMVEACCDGGVASQEGCNFYSYYSSECTSEVYEAQSIIYSGDFNWYGIYNDCHKGDGNKLSSSTNPEYGRTRMDADFDNMFRDLKKRVGITKTKSITRGDPPCIDTTNIKKWINTPEVREALHIPSHVQDWELCSDLVGQLYERQYAEMSSQFNYLLEHTKGLIYNGDWDLACNHLGNKWFINGLQLTELTGYEQWYYDDQVAGFVKSYPNLDWVQVKGSGHMVPEDTPGASLKMIYNWIEGKPLK